MDMTTLEHPVHFGTSKEESLKDRESSKNEHLLG